MSMYLGSKGELVFNTPEDRVFLDELIMNYRSNPIYQKALETASEVTNREIGIEPTDAVSVEKLRELMDATEKAALSPPTALATLPHTAETGVSPEVKERLLRRAKLSSSGITYTLPKEWTTFILAGAFGMSQSAEVHEAEIAYLKSGELGYHFVGMSDEEARELIEEAERTEREQGVDILDTGEQAVDYAKENLDKAVHAAGIVLEIFHRYDMGRN